MRTTDGSARPETASQRAEQAYKDRTLRKPKSFLSLEDLSAAEIETLIDGALEAKRFPSRWSQRLTGQSVALLFEKTSTRTRCSFETAICEIGGFPFYIDWKTSNFVIGDIRDEIKVLSRYYGFIVARVNRHETLEIMATESEVPIINGLSDLGHPCQALADLMTIREYYERLDGVRVTYIGDPNNVCRSLVQGASKVGMRITICSPDAYRPDESLVTGEARANIRVCSNPVEAVHDADVIYTDSWVSMGQEAEADFRLPHFEPYQVNDALLSHAPVTSLIMHCLPAHRGQEITADALRSPHSIVFDQAENRKHAQKALLGWLADVKQGLR